MPEWCPTCLYHRRVLADGRIEVEGVAVRRVVPDVAVWHARVTAVAEERRAAFAQASERATAVLAAVRAAAGEAGETWAEGIGVGPRWEPGKRRPTGWEASGRVGVRTGLDGADAAGQAALDAGADTLEGPYFEIAGERAIRDELLAEAVRAARARAEAMAGAAGRQLGAAVALTDGPRRGSAPPEYPMARMALALSDDAAPPPAAPEGTELEVRVLVRFELAG
jgi:uncharacterized protein YggE